MDRKSRTVSDDTVVEWVEQDREPMDAAHDPEEAPVTDPAAKYAESQLRVVRETRDYQLGYIQHALQPGRELIDISPAYQRRLRWNNKKRSLLIESFLMNIPVPPIFLFERDYNSFEVVDGRQRLDAVSSYLNNEYSLSGLEYWPELNKKRFSSLPGVLKNGLLRRTLPAVVLLAESSSDKEDGIDVRRALFDRLNTGGIQLNPQELRNALYPGRLNALLIRLARKDEFTSVWAIPRYSDGEEQNPPRELMDTPLYARMGDAELVLRFLALRDAVVNRKTGSLRQIMDRYMEQYQNVDEGEARELESLFVMSLRELQSVFGGDTFRLPGNGRLSRPLYDALMIAQSRSGALLGQHKEEIHGRLKAALDDPDSYEVLVGRGNTIAAIHERVELASELLGAG